MALPASELLEPSGLQGHGSNTSLPTRCNGPVFQTLPVWANWLTRPFLAQRRPN